MFKKFGPKRSFGGDSRGGGSRPDLHDAVCADCGNDCKVPFRPNSGRPVFCRDCFQNQDQGGAQGSSYDRPRFESRSERRSERPERFNDRENSYDRPARPSYERPGHSPYERYDRPAYNRPAEDQNVYNKPVAPKASAPEKAPVAGISQAQYEVLNRKLDRIIELLDFVAEEAEELMDSDEFMEEMEDLTPVQAPKAKKTSAKKETTEKAVSKAKVKEEVSDVKPAKKSKKTV